MMHTADDIPGTIARKRRKLDHPNAAREDNNQKLWITDETISEVSPEEAMTIHSAPLDQMDRQDENCVCREDCSLNLAESTKVCFGGVGH
jgi:hypothetical protein